MYCRDYILRLLVINLVVLLFSQSIFADSRAMDKVERIKGNSIYYYGEGTGASLEEAHRAALVSLSQNIKMTIGSQLSGVETNFSSSISHKTSISSFTTLENTQEIIIKDEPGARVFRYILKEDVEYAISERAEKIKLWSKTGLEMEGKLEIASALKYLYWAYSLSTVHPQVVKLDIGGESVDAKIWLHAKISTILNGINVRLDNVEERPEDIDRYLVNLIFEYDGHKISDLQFKYDNGYTFVEGMHAKNGAGSLPFDHLPQEEINLGFEYRYIDEGKRFDSELLSLYESVEPAVFTQAGNNVKFDPSQKQFDVKGKSVNKFKMTTPKQDKELAQAIANDAAIAPTKVKEGRKLVEADQLDAANATHYVSIMEQVEKAIMNRQFDVVRQYFTYEGYNLFMQMMQIDNRVGTTKITVTKTKDRGYNIQKSNNFIIGKSIPVQIQYGRRHSVNEEIIFRFNEEGLVQSVAYALSKHAEDEIFRQNSWDMDARFAIKQFMEDYQTAFALKRLDYINSIFSDSAIIITGKRSNAPKRIHKGADGNFLINLSDDYQFTRHTKDSYMQALKSDFSKKKFIKITFEENEIFSPSGVTEDYDNIYWIQLKQFYNSDLYSDIGFLALMIDMRDKENPVIKVRTWNPEKIPVDDLVKSYHIGD